VDGDSVKLKRILFISYSDVRYDGRMRELRKVAERLGKVYSISEYDTEENVNYFSLNKINKKGILAFTCLALRVGEKIKNIDILFVDNRMSCITGLFLCKIFKEVKVIQDIRELYLFSERKSLKSKLGCIIEQNMIKKADIIISANKYRSKFMKNYYHLRNEPLVFENVRRLEYSDKDSISDYEIKYTEIIKKDRIRVISTSGCDVKRTNDLLVKSMNKVGNKIDLLIIGGSNKKDKEYINYIIKKNNLKNVFILDKVPEGELKYLISKCHIGIVNYGQYDINNKLCASGKIFEFLYEGIPVVTTDNMPLKNFCNSYGVGFSGNNYEKGIMHVIENYAWYKNNIEMFFRNYSDIENVEMLVDEIKKRLV